MLVLQVQRLDPDSGNVNKCGSTLCFKDLLPRLCQGCPKYPHQPRTKADHAAPRRVFGTLAAAGVIAYQMLPLVVETTIKDLSLDVAAGEDDPGPLGLHGWVMPFCCF